MRKIIASLGIAAVAAAGFGISACAGASSSQSPQAANTEACKILLHKDVDLYGLVTQNGINQAEKIVVPDVPKSALAGDLLHAEAFGGTFGQLTHQFTTDCAVYHVTA